MRIFGIHPKRAVFLIGLVVLEGASIYEAIKCRSVVPLLIISPLFLLLFATVYWIDWIVRRNVTNFEVCMVIGGVVLTADLCFMGFYAFAVVAAGLTIYGAYVLVRRLLRKVDQEEQEANLNRYKSEGNSLSPIKSDAISLSFFVIVIAALWAFNGFKVPEYAEFIILLAGWDAVMLVYHIITGKISKSKGIAPIESATNSGGRA